MATSIGNDSGKTGFFRPDLFILAYTAGTIKAAREDWKYWRSLKAQGYNEAAGSARLAFFADVVNVFISVKPHITPIIFHKPYSAEAWATGVIPGLFVCSLYSDKMIANAREKQLAQKFAQEGLEGPERQEYTAIVANQLVVLNQKLERLTARKKEGSRKGREISDKIKARAELLDDLTVYTLGSQPLHL